MADRLYPTPARLALLDDIAASNVFRDAIGDSYISGHRKVTAEIRDMQTAGWVSLPPGDGTRTWQLTPYGRAIAAIRILDFGAHIVAETGDPDEPRVLGQAIPGPRRSWSVALTTGQPVAVHGKAAAVAELRHMAATALAAEYTTTSRVLDDTDLSEVEATH
jgi:hypothetical protein